MTEASKTNNGKTKKKSNESKDESKAEPAKGEKEEKTTEKNNTDTVPTGNKSNPILAVAIAIGFAFLAWAMNDNTTTGSSSSIVKESTPAPTPITPITYDNPIESLMEDWLGPEEERTVEIKDIDTCQDDQDDCSPHRGLFAKKDFAKGDIMVKVEVIDLRMEIFKEHQELPKLLNDALDDEYDEHEHSWDYKSLLAVIQFLLIVEDHKQGKPTKWSSYIESLPKSFPSLGTYWTDEEKKCLVERPIDPLDDFINDQRAFHAVLERVKDEFPPLGKIYNRQTTEWAFNIWNTRSFDTSHLYPILDFADHNSADAAPVFILQKKQEGSLVAIRDIKAGEQVFNNYGFLSIFETASHYGFVENNPAFFDVPSIDQDIQTSPLMLDEGNCKTSRFKFVGNVTAGLVEAKRSLMKYEHEWKPLRPTEDSYTCIQEMFPDKSPTELAGYIAEKLEEDWKRYDGMAKAEHCHSTEGNFGLIREANEKTAALMLEALKVAKQGQEGIIPYPYEAPETKDDSE